MPMVCRLLDSIFLWESGDFVNCLTALRVVNIMEESNAMLSCEVCFDAFEFRFHMKRRDCSKLDGSYSRELMILPGSRFCDG
jgi:hypothetical protein